MPKKLDDLRAELDEIDAGILSLLAKRFEKIKLIGELKKEKNIPVLQKNREEVVLNRAQKAALENNIDSAYFEKIYKVIISGACDLENLIIDGK